jgi:hypothetical protein
MRHVPKIKCVSPHGTVVFIEGGALAISFDASRQYYLISDESIPPVNDAGGAPKGYPMRAHVPCTWVIDLTLVVE